MDISVSQLNHRLALQLPAELPLGLVFVTGVVRNLEEGGEHRDGRAPFTSFDLEQKGHRLRCRLVQREADKLALHDQVEVRLGGHLSFDSRRAEYYLLARDAEVVSAVGDKKPDLLALDLSELVGDQAAFAAALGGIKRRADVSKQSPASVPVWVQKIAPLEVKEGEDEPTEEPDEEAPILAAQPPAETALNEEMVSYLSALMESEEEVELTPNILAQWTSEPHEPVVDMLEDEPSLSILPAASEQDEAGGEVVTAVSPYDPVGDVTPKPKPARPRPAQPRPRQQTDWAVILLLVAIIVFTIVILFAAILLR
ncbi:MAG TPA: hypothetical protein PLD25_28870 [Chloroflexota bacterium]|nr:hypothetical protein [Chloroflexota bacterium]